MIEAYNDPLFLRFLYVAAGVFALLLGLLFYNRERVETWWLWRVVKQHDPNMVQAIRWATDSYSHVLRLSPRQRVKIIEGMEKILFRGKGGLLQDLTSVELAEKFAQGGDLWKTTNAEDNLRIWAGCIMGAKVLALQTRTGKTTRKMRKVGAERLQRWCEVDLVVRAGAEVAPLFKAGRKEPVSYDGVPAGSVLWILREET